MRYSLCPGGTLGIVALIGTLLCFHICMSVICKDSKEWVHFQKQLQGDCPQSSPGWSSSLHHHGALTDEKHSLFCPSIPESLRYTIITLSDWPAVCISPPSQIFLRDSQVLCDAGNTLHITHKAPGKQRNLPKFIRWFRHRQRWNDPSLAAFISPLVCHEYNTLYQGLRKEWDNCLFLGW